MKIDKNKVKITEETIYEISDYKLITKSRKLQLEKLIESFSAKLETVNNQIKELDKHEAK